MISITSRENPRFKILKRWANQGRARRSAGMLLLDGLHLLEAATAAGVVLETIVVEAAAHNKHTAWLAAHGDTETILLPDRLFAELADTETPSGLLGFARIPAPKNEAPPDADCVLLDGVQDPGNLGTLLRTAAAAGIEEILLSPACADPWSPKALRAGQGAQFLLNIHLHCDLAAFLRSYHGQSIATLPDAPQSLFNAPLSTPAAWIFGAEGQGVGPELIALATQKLSIPMPGKIESLNVAAAAALCLFEKVRRKELGNL
ncbi:MAG: RNA methyltransferase [Betaproteobacteria bacterium]|nr:RNA methyltransferase [Betaproteobacteria bacterium]